MHAVPPTVPASTVQEEQRATPGLFGRMMARIRGREGALPMAVAGIARRLKSELRHPLDGFRHEKIAPGGGLVPTLPRQDFSREIDAAFVALVRDRVDALFVFPDPFFVTRRVQIAALAARHAVPATYPSRDFAEVSGLMSYGTNIADAWRQVGVYSGRILKGAQPADLPVVQSTKFELVVNAQTARMLGLTVPPALLATADEVIE
jgi:ABC transporter substrate binding protein